MAPADRTPAPFSQALHSGRSDQATDRRREPWIERTGPRGKTAEVQGESGAEPCVDPAIFSTAEASFLWAIRACQPMTIQKIVLMSPRTPPHKATEATPEMAWVVGSNGSSFWIGIL